MNARFQFLRWDSSVGAAGLSAAGFVILLIVTLRFGLFPFFYTNLSRAAYWLMAFVTAGGMVGSLISHEVIHGLWEGSPEDSRWQQASRYLSALGFNLLLSMGFTALALLSDLNWGSDVLVGILFHLGAFNLTLVLFELLPALPLDGGQVLLSLSARHGRPAWWVADLLFWLGLGIGLILIMASVYQYLHGRPFISLWMWCFGFLLGKRSFDALDHLRPRKRRPAP